MTRYFPELVAAVKAEVPERSVVDGEIVIPDGRDSASTSRCCSSASTPPRPGSTCWLSRRPPSSSPSTCSPWETTNLTDQPFAERRAALEQALAEAGTSVHLTPATTDRDVARAGSASSRAPGSTGWSPSHWGGPTSRQAHDVQDQARAHRRLRGRRLPRPQERAGRWSDRCCSACSHAEGSSGQRGRHRLVPDGPAPGADRRAAAAGHRASTSTRGAGRGRRRAPTPRNAGTQPVERGQGPVASPRCGPSGWSRSRYDHMEGPRFRHTAQFVAVAPRPGARLLHLRPAGGAGQLQSGRDPVRQGPLEPTSTVRGDPVGHRDHPATEKSVLFIIPRGQRSILGTTDTDWTGDRAEPAATGEDIDYILEHANRILARPLTRADVIGVYAGLRPLIAASDSTPTTKLSREHVVDTPVPGLTSIAVAVRRPTGRWPAT